MEKLALVCETSLSFLSACRETDMTDANLDPKAIDAHETILRETIASIEQLQADPQSRRRPSHRATLQEKESFWYHSPHSHICRYLFARATLGVEACYIRFDDEPLPWTEEEGRKQEHAQRGRQSLTTISIERYEKTMYALISELRHQEGESTYLLFESFGFRPLQFNYILETDECENDLRKWLLGRRFQNEEHCKKRELSEVTEPTVSDFDSRFWYKAYVASSPSRSEMASDKKLHILPGYFECSASPQEFYSPGECAKEFRSRKKSMVISLGDKEFNLGDTKKIDEELKRISSASSADLNAAIKAAHSTQEPYSLVDIYNVGEGNCIRIYTANDSHRFIYDIGRGIKNRYGQMPQAFQGPNMCIGFNPDLVILSHWDADHTHGYAYCSDDIFQCKWIAPSFKSYGSKEAPKHMLRLAKYLYERGCLLFVHQPGGTQPLAVVRSAGVDFEIWQGGNGHGDSEVTLQNRHGLILCCCASQKYVAPRKEALLLGDVPYSCLDSSLQNLLGTISCIVVPHHGRKLNTKPLPSNPSTQIQRYAIVSGGDKLEAAHEDALRKAGFAVYKTKGAKLKMTLSFSRPPAPPNLSSL